jgi:predicted RNA polymerase sigma factor
MRRWHGCGVAKITSLHPSCRHSAEGERREARSLVPGDRAARGRLGQHTAAEREAALEQARRWFAEHAAKITHSICLLFNEGYLTTTEGARPQARHLADDAGWLATLLAGLMPEGPEVLGLLALIRPHQAPGRRPFRRGRAISRNGTVLLEGVTWA